MTGEDIRKASLAEMNTMDESAFLPTESRVQDDILPDNFWETAEVVFPTEKRSVHLKLEPEVFDYFKTGGKGHLTRMQKVLTAYVRAQKARS